MMNVVESGSFELNRVIMFVKFRNVVFPKQLMDGVGLADTSEALPERRLLWDLFKQSVTDDAQNAESLDEMLKTIFIKGLKLPIVDSWVDNEGSTVFIIMGRMMNVYKTLVWTAGLNHDFIKLGIVMDTQMVVDSGVNMRTESYCLVFPKTTDKMKTVMHQNLMVSLGDTTTVLGQNWVDVTAPFGLKYYADTKDVKKNIATMHSMFEETPEYVKALLSLTSPAYCAGMFNDVKTGVSHIVSQF